MKIATRRYAESSSFRDSTMWRKWTRSEVGAHAAKFVSTYSMITECKCLWLSDDKTAETSTCSQLRAREKTTFRTYMESGIRSVYVAARFHTLTQQNIMRHRVSIQMKQIWCTSWLMCTTTISLMSQAWWLSWNRSIRGGVRRLSYHRSLRKTTMHRVGAQALLMTHLYRHYKNCFEACTNLNKKS